MLGQQTPRIVSGRRGSQLRREFDKRGRELNVRVEGQLIFNNLASD